MAVETEGPEADRRRHRRRCGPWLPALIALVAACTVQDQDSTSQTPTLDVVLAGGASDEALKNLLEATPLVDSSQAVVIDEPGHDDSVPIDELGFFYHVGGGVAVLPVPAPPVLGSTAAPHRSSAETVLSWFVSEAHAHGAPLNGRGYLLVFTGGDGVLVARVFTDELSYSPDGQIRAALDEAVQPITFEVINGLFDNNEIVTGGGPFSGEPVDFRVSE